MNIQKIKTNFFLIIYYSIVSKLPSNTSIFVGLFIRKIRGFVCSQIFKYSGDNIDIGRNIYFGNGADVEIGHNSGIGNDSRITNNLVIGNDVMIAPNLVVLGPNHNFDRLDIPMNKQGVSKKTLVKIENDVWIGTNVILGNKITIKKGSIIAAGSVVTKDNKEYSIYGGNPASLIKYRYEKN
ncbi:acyltransferase [Flammeovirga aprica]|uniref:Acyltransferase n=1 Tax=Flammeovirga aprica JL-4 TaxID=694437 RepID=A0A7X9RTS7_9BACT|nr:acyltransferase [Flammeovirga aprica]NME67667.1 acyltransferase [Flammeovirga aprica JL-4]